VDSSRLSAIHTHAVQATGQFCAPVTVAGRCRQLVLCRVPSRALSALLERRCHATAAKAWLPAMFLSQSCEWSSRWVVLPPTGAVASLHRHSCSNCDVARETVHHPTTNEAYGRVSRGMLNGCSWDGKCLWFPFVAARRGQKEVQAQGHSASAPDHKRGGKHAGALHPSPTHLRPSPPSLSLSSPLLNGAPSVSPSFLGLRQKQRKGAEAGRRAGQGRAGQGRAGQTTREGDGRAGGTRETRADCRFHLVKCQSLAALTHVPCCLCCVSSKLRSPLSPSTMSGTVRASHLLIKHKGSRR
jgi:hypothetical protein